MSRKVWLISVSLALLLINAYPLFQLFTSGHLFYKNAYDETTYLQYEVSREVQGISRPGQYLVTMAHEAGLSGGWINFVLDTVTFLAFVAGVRAVLREVGFDGSAARLHSMLVALVPSVFLLSNPMVRTLAEHILSGGLVYWVNMPQANFLPLVRSPEPQMSLVFLLLCLLLCLKFKTFAPAYLALPFLYPFICVPVAFVLVAFHLRTRVTRLARHSALAPLVSFVIVSVGAWIYFDLFTTAGVKEALAHTRAPLFSVIGFLCLATYWGVRKKIEASHRSFALLIALSPIAAGNQQIISGSIAQPCGFEQYFGVYCLPAVLVLAWKRDPMPAAIAVLLGALTLAFSARIFFEFNHSLNRDLVLNHDVAARLQGDSPRIAFKNTESAALAGMIFPRQRATLFAYAKTYSTPRVKENFAQYLCAKRAFLSDAATAKEFQGVFATLDPAFQYENRDFILLHLGRKKSFRLENDPDRVPASCPAANYWLATRLGQLETFSQKPFRLYTSPADLRVTHHQLTYLPPPPSAADLVLKSDILRIEPEQWAAAGAQVGLLAQSKSRPVGKGSLFVAQGELRHGGFDVGLIKDDRWVRSVSVKNTGMFAIVIEAPEDGEYALAFANPAVGTTENDFVISRAGWIDPLRGVIYAVPANLPSGMSQKLLQQDLRPVEESGIVFQASNLRREGGQWISDGPAAGPFVYLLSTQARQIRQGAYLVAQGELRQGGLTLGLIKDQRWAVQANIFKTGRFTVVIEVPEAGTYAPVLANYLTSGSMTNDFVLTRLGWAEE